AGHVFPSSLGFFMRWLLPQVGDGVQPIAVAMKQEIEQEVRIDQSWPWLGRRWPTSGELASATRVGSLQAALLSVYRPGSSPPFLTGRPAPVRRRRPGPALPPAGRRPIHLAAVGPHAPGRGCC